MNRLVFVTANVATWLLLVGACSSNSTQTASGDAEMGGVSGQGNTSGGATTEIGGTGRNAGVGNSGTGGDGGNSGGGTSSIVGNAGTNDASATRDAGGSALDGGADSGPPDFNACDGTQVCTADYPCQDLPAPSLGYTCRGQFADWKPLDSPTFKDNGDKTVTDLHSGLLWQQSPESQLYKFADAKAYCSGLSLAGKGWRLPTRA
ncbi:MAG TPA: hypothetical protein VL137_18255, partial [Polyangiaceae bacterium]|nr:hypothetical protein [Polyangiaceae bacterium]